MIEVNLIPDVKQELIKAQQTRTVVVGISTIIGLFSIGVVVLLALYIFTIQTVRGVLVDKAITDDSKTLSKVEDLSKILTIQNQLTKISSLNSNKKIDSRIFDVIMAVNPKEPNDILFSKLTINPEDETILIEGQASAGYSASEMFKKTIESAKLKYKDGDGESKETKLASGVALGETSYGQDSAGKKVLRFNMTFKYAKELFSPDSKSLTISISGAGNVTDSYLGVPKSVFVDKATDLTEGQ